MMRVEIGHTAGLDIQAEGSSPVPITGKRTTKIVMPEGMSVADAYLSILDALRYHIQEGHKPAWVKSNNPSIQSLLLKHFEMTTKDNVRPANWGEENP